MAKKQKLAASESAARTSSRVKDRDAATGKKIVELADRVAKRALSGNEPTVSIPTRARSNTIWNKKRRILEMGSAAQERQLFNLNQAKSFMQTLLHSSSIKDLIGAEKTLSLRGMFYKGLHTVAGTKEKTFADQDESDGILEDLEVSLTALREELHVFAKKAGSIVGNITLIDSGDEIDCRPAQPAPSWVRAGRRSADGQPGPGSALQCRGPTTRRLVGARCVWRQRHAGVRGV